jgi:hypothetical protein
VPFNASGTGKRRGNSRNQPVSTWRLGIIGVVTFHQQKGYDIYDQGIFVQNQGHPSDWGRWKLTLQFRGPLSPGNVIVARSRDGLRLVAHLDRWLSKRIPLAQVDETLISAFLEARRKIQSRAIGDSRTLFVLLHYLRTTGVTPVPRSRTPRSCFDQIVEDYEDFLIEQRCLAAGSIPIYVSVVKRFLKHRFPDGKIRLRELRADI